MASLPKSKRYAPIIHLFGRFVPRHLDFKDPLPLILGNERLSIRVIEVFARFEIFGKLAKPLVQVVSQFCSWSFFLLQEDDLANRALLCWVQVQEYMVIVVVVCQRNAQTMP
jgi:hypothetical protein